MVSERCCGCGKRTRGSHTLITEQNIGAVSWIFDLTGRCGAPELGGYLCKTARPKAAIGRPAGSGEHVATDVAPCLSVDEAKFTARILVGKPVAKFFKPPGALQPTKFFYGTLTLLTLDDLPSLSDMMEGDADWSLHLRYEAVFESAPEEHRAVLMSQEEAVFAHDSYLALQSTLSAAETTAQRRETRKAKAAAPVPIDEEEAGLSRPLSRSTIFESGWWEKYSKGVSPSLHQHLFGFPDRSLMLHFFETFFSEDLKAKGHLGLTQMEPATIALWRMRCAPPEPEPEHEP